MVNPRDRAKERVTVIGPIDNAPGKKMTYPVREMKRGQAESRGAKRLGIQIVPNGARSVTVSHTQNVEVEMENGTRLDPKDQAIAELQAQVRELIAASQKKKPGRKPKVKADAAQA